jgi:ribonuclease P protein component
MSLKFGPGVRLRSHREFAAAQHRGRRIATRYLTVLVSPNRTGRDRLGIIASRRLGGAIVRNRAKRRIRELFRQQQPQGAAPHSATFDVVVIPRREFLTAPFDVIRADFHLALGRARGGRAS